MAVSARAEQQDCIAAGVMGLCLGGKIWIPTRIATYISATQTTLTIVVITDIESLVTLTTPARVGAELVKTEESAMEDLISDQT